jgi:hypothetical protein
MPEYYHLLVNIEDHPDFIPKARALALDFLTKGDFSDPHYEKFDYTLEAFNQRMKKIYDDFVADMESPHWLDTGDLGDQQVGRFSDAAVFEQLRQKAPFNLTDGAWLQNILHTGPCNQVQANLFSIWVDEAGNGRTELNHCNVYDTLLRSGNIFLPPIASKDFIDVGILPSAYESSVFQICVGLFPEDFLPELLGMTLYLEWEATPTLTPTVRMLRNRNISPHFYQLHVAIDNISAGHGALAKEAIELYLEQIGREGGDAQVQSQWRRIWNGYVTWATLGTFGSDLIKYLLQFDGKGTPEQQKEFARQRMIELVQKKAPVAGTSHGNARLGGKRLNELFADPPALLEALLNDPQKLINLQSPRNSRFFTELLSFSGPMYKVFTEVEQDIILDWIESLKDTPVPPPPPTDIGSRMRDVLHKYQPTAGQVVDHDGFHLPDQNGKSVRAWFNEGSLEQMMNALAQSEFITPGSAQNSTFFTDVLVNLMPGAIAQEDVAIMREWVDKNCPQPAASATPPQPLAKLNASIDKIRSAEVAVGFALKKRVVGMGDVH